MSFDTPAKMSLRAATGDDVEFLTDVAITATRDQGRLPADFDEAEYRVGFADWTREQVRGEIPGSSTYVVEVDGEPAGRLRVIRDPELVELAGIQLLPKFQSRGIGTRLIEQVMEEARSTGRRFELSVEKDNPRARALYERLGMVEVGESETEGRLARLFEA